MQTQDILALLIVAAAAVYIGMRVRALMSSRKAACNCGSKRGCERMNDTLRALPPGKHIP